MRPSTIGVRRYSCPPLSPKDLYEGYFYNLGRNDLLQVDPALLKEYSRVEVLTEVPGRSVYLLDDKFILKLFAPYNDVDAIVRTTRLASRIVPVPRVLKHGRSGNCCFILMDFLRGPDLLDPAHVNHPFWVLRARLEYDMRDAVLRLQQCGLSHHDLYLSNVFIDRYCRLSAIYDWDYARREPYGEEYLRRVTNDCQAHDWDYMFARNLLPFGTGFVANPADGPTKLEIFDPYMPSLTTVHDSNVEHVLDPLKITISKPARKRLVILAGSDGSNVPQILDDKQEGQGYWSLKGYELARIFTFDAVSDRFVRARNIPAASYSDMLVVCTTPEQEFARLIARERPDIVLLVNWHIPLSKNFFEAMSVPTDLCDPASLPVVLRLNVVHAPVVLRPASAEAAKKYRATAIATMVQGYAQPEATLFVQQTPSFDITVADEFSRTMFGVQRRMARDIVSTWGSRTLG